MRFFKGQKGKQSKIEETKSFIEDFNETEENKKNDLFILLAQTYAIHIQSLKAKLDIILKQNILATNEIERTQKIYLRNIKLLEQYDLKFLHLDRTKERLEQKQKIEIDFNINFDDPDSDDEEDNITISKVEYDSSFNKLTQYFDSYKTKLSDIHKLILDLYSETEIEKFCNAFLKEKQIYDDEYKNQPRHI